MLTQAWPHFRPCAFPICHKVSQSAFHTKNKSKQTNNSKKPQTKASDCQLKHLLLTREVRSQEPVYMGRGLQPRLGSRGPHSGKAFSGSPFSERPSLGPQGRPVWPCPAGSAPGAAEVGGCVTCHLHRSGCGAHTSPLPSGRSKLTRVRTRLAQVRACSSASVVSGSS